MTPPSSPRPAQGRAARVLLSSLVNEPELAQIKLHQAATLKELAALREGIAAVNRRSAEQYARRASELVAAARVAKQVKGDLNDISHRLVTLKKKLALMQAQPPAASGAASASQHAD